MGKQTDEALEKARELERHPLQDNEEIVGLYHEDMEKVEKIRKLLVGRKAKKKTSQSKTI